MRDYIKIARFDHWIKQLFILPGVLLAASMTPSGGRTALLPLALLLGLLATSAAASANYCINEWLDAEFDKYHPIKKHRPFVTKKLSAAIVLVEYAIFAAASIGLALLINTAVVTAIALLLVMGILYNVRPIRTKDLPYVDVLSESINNAIRLAIGWFCVTGAYYPPISVVLGYWMGGAFLMAAKRFAEYRMIGDPEQAGLYRRSFRFYNQTRLLLSALFYGFLSVFFIGVFLVKYKIELIIAIPPICGLFCYYFSLCFKADSVAQKPEKLYKEKGLLLFCLFVVIVFVVSYYIHIPALDMFLQTELVKLAQ
ncbi:MAG: UbiA family prenyltransferase [Oscillospiraceae bacterium]|jgi:4-hydroxybenzoate polyprenyltransferase|nr:UbiA family prenyltransferase [Oscillospiraceae bacterium]